MNIEVKLDPDMWRHIVGAAEIVATEINLNFEPEGLTVHQLSSDKGNMIYAVLPSSEFIEYAVDEQQTVILKLGQLSKMNKRLSGIQIIQVLRKEGDNRLGIVLHGEENERAFDFPILLPEGEAKDLRAPTIDPQAEFQIAPEALRDILKDIELIGGLPTIQVEKDFIEVFVDDPTEGKVHVTMKVGEELYGLTKTSDSLIACRYPIDRLKSMTTAFSGSDPLFKTAHRKPLHVELGLGDTGSVTIVIAPVLDRRQSEPKKETKKAKAEAETEAEPEAEE